MDGSYIPTYISDKFVRVGELVKEIIKCGLGY